MKSRQFLVYEIMTKGVKILPLDLKNGDWYHFRGQLTTVELTYNLQSKLKKLLTFLPIHRLLMNAVVKGTVYRSFFTELQHIQNKRVKGLLVNITQKM